MVSIGICDDEEPELESLRGLVAAYARGRGLRFEISSFGSGEDLLMAREGGADFDVVFLDVYMGLTNGVDIARELREAGADCCIVFATNSRSHAIDGYGVHALQYLLKPLSERNVSMALDQALDSLSRRKERFIQLSNRLGRYRIRLGDIVYAESDARVVVVHLRGREDLSFYMRLDDLERLCDDGRFLRCHKSFLVNLDFVYAVESRSLRLETGQSVRFSMSPQAVKSLFAAYVARAL
ncbi:MAG: LytTR family DNA-binding domain-containing protein [Spirochaetes bacterium]|nr:LytTR family DNA-binding domain-containing protein [Spirochaetota bacterium]MBU1080032.1 LytTR family DNA-binding domain-containing protein [Spirochaetota bacterium]